MDILRRTDILRRMLLLLLAACGEAAVNGRFALAFDGSPDCVQVELEEDPPAVLTVEAWVRGDPSEGDAARPFVNVGGVFSLDQDREGALGFSVGADSGRAAYAFSVMDGVLHHVAGTYADGKASIFLDGERMAFSSATLDGSSVGTLRIGCSGAGDHLRGLLDEVRISAVDRYPEDFEPVEEPFDLDDDTWALFHLDEGFGDRVADAAGGPKGIIDGADWVEFQLGGSGVGVAQ